MYTCATSTVGGCASHAASGCLGSSGFTNTLASAESTDGRASSATPRHSNGPTWFSTYRVPIHDTRFVRCVRSRPSPTSLRRRLYTHCASDRYHSHQHCDHCGLSISNVPSNSFNIHRRNCAKSRTTRILNLRIPRKQSPNVKTTSVRLSSGDRSNKVRRKRTSQCIVAGCNVEVAQSDWIEHCATHGRDFACSRCMNIFADATSLEAVHIGTA